MPSILAILGSMHDCAQGARCGEGYADRRHRRARQVLHGRPEGAAAHMMRRWWNHAWGGGQWDMSATGSGWRGSAKEIFGAIKRHASNTSVTGICAIAFHSALGCGMLLKG